MPDDAGFAAEYASTINVAPMLNSRAPLASARAFVTLRHTSGTTRTLHYHGGLFHAWTGTHYPEVEPAALKCDLYGFLDGALQVQREGAPTPFNPNRAKVADVMDALAAIANLPGQYRPPAWLDSRQSPAPSELIACSNGLLHLPTLELTPHTPEFFALNALPFAFECGADAPAAWLAFLTSIWPDDPSAIETLQEMFGLFLTGITLHQKAFLIVGPKRSGKGTIARVLTMLLGQDSVVGPTLSGIGQNFGLAPLIGKRVAIISDARLGSRADQQVIAERLLSVTGEDVLTIDRKYLSAWTGRLQTRFLILTNEMPRLADASGALASRFIVLSMTKTFFGKEDHGLTDRISREMPAILNWAIAGWQRLNCRGYFQQPASSLDAIAQLEELGSPISAFIRARCIIHTSRSVRTDKLYQAWCDWAREGGREHVGTLQMFGRDLHAAVPGLTMIRPRAEDGERIRYYRGIDIDG